MFNEKTDETDRYRIEFDGSCNPNPGIMGIGYIIRDPHGDTVQTYSAELGWGTNNVAEYMALIEALKFCASQKIKKIEIYGDSTIVIDAVNGKGLKDHKRHPNIRPLIAQVRELLTNFDRWTATWNRRDENADADLLSNGFSLPSAKTVAKSLDWG